MGGSVVVAASSSADYLDCWANLDMRADMSKSSSLVAVNFAAAAQDL
jgi:hypothetical protein